MLSSIFDGSLGADTLALLIISLTIALGFEFVNGFHDTANAVATVIYTKSLTPRVAVVWSGFCNFLGVCLGGTAVAFAVVNLLPVELLITVGSRQGMAMVLALLVSATAWNLGTWYLGLPASSSHTLIGGIIGVGLANALTSGHTSGGGVDWSKAGEVGLSLLLSPSWDSCWRAPCCWSSGFSLATRSSTSPRRPIGPRRLGSEGPWFSPVRGSVWHTGRMTGKKGSG